MSGILVLDGEQRAALAVTRSLGKRQLRVHIGSHLRASIGGGSRYALSESLLPHPLRDGNAFALEAAQLAKALGVDIVMPITEASTLALLEYSPPPLRAMLPVPSLATFNLARDKQRILSIAAELGICVPEQWTGVHNEEDAHSIPADKFPVVVKPTRSVVGGPDGGRTTSVQYATSPEHLARLAAARGPNDGALLIQERIVGPGLGVFLLRWEGEVVTQFAHRRVREKPPSGGVSTCSESMSLPPALLAQASALLAAVDWTGVAMVEFKHDLKSGRNYLMEVNPRFWGSLQLSIDSGVDFPWYLVQLFRGVGVTCPQHWRIGARSRWWLGELDHLIARLRHSRAALNLPNQAPALPFVIASTLPPWLPGHRSEVFRWSDPVPGVREAVQWLREL